jgi:hypothetical protein
MARLEKMTSDRIRVCRLCEQPIQCAELAYVMRGVHVPPKKRDLHMHIECLHAEIQFAQHR